MTATRSQIDVQNPMRVARAWEVLQGTGQSIRKLAGTDPAAAADLWRPVTHCI